MPPVIAKVVTPSFVVHTGGALTAISQTLPPVTAPKIMSPLLVVIATVAAAIKPPAKSFPGGKVWGVVFS